MLPYEEEAGEQLWKHIEERKRSDVSADGSGTHNGTTSEEMASLFSLADVVSEVLQRDSSVAGGQAEARTRLVAAIKLERESVRPVPHPTGISIRERFSNWNSSRQRQLALVLALLLLALSAAFGYKAWQDYQQSCHTVPLTKTSAVLHSACPLSLMRTTKIAASAVPNHTRH